MRCLCLVSFLSTWLVSCQARTSSRPAVAPVPHGTYLRVTDTATYLLRNGQPYFIKGAAGTSRLQRLREVGGNSIRIWDDTDAGRLLDRAQQLGLTVCFGLWIEREIEGFDYNDQEAVERQYERARQAVLKYRHHPALLMWCVGNEAGMEAWDIRVYDEINRVAEFIHEVDPHHPVTTALTLTSPRTVWVVRDRCPALDILSVNVYGEADKAARTLRAGGWEGPYLFSEFGTRGYWNNEVPSTPWHTPREPSDPEKTAYLRDVYRRYIDGADAQCVGSYVFYWGYKQEETHTWYSLFDERGNETPLVETLQELWTGRPPTNRAPQVRSVGLNGQAKSYLSVDPGTVFQAEVSAVDPDGDSLRYHWELRPTARSAADYLGTEIQPLSGLISTPAAARTVLRFPAQPGRYRLFVSVYDTHQHVGSANVPVQVRAPR
jgi:hypothetical protein